MINLSNKNIAKAMNNGESTGNVVRYNKIYTRTQCNKNTYVDILFLYNCSSITLYQSYPSILNFIYYSLVRSIIKLYSKWCINDRICKKLTDKKNIL